MIRKMQHCDWCGVELGVSINPGNNPKSCEDPECDQGINAIYESEQAEANRQKRRGDGVRDQAKQARGLIAALRELNTEGMVCDSVMPCHWWEKYYPEWKNLCCTFTYCPGCGKTLDWQNWKRLRCGGNL
uniref:Uncharacterized protein n=1 Tax=Candidatus Desulfatibia profunda TaxID=2841695 RepID=A0A8J6NVF8_9BACT|nr:hypothetical protein [Candidatus Desulfatibia profunda]